MFEQKDLFNNRWGLSLSTSKTAENVASSCITVDNPLPKTFIIFGKKNYYYNRIVNWLTDNNIEYFISNVFGDAVELTIIFNY
jgi:hypothetical protein